MNPSRSFPVLAVLASAVGMALFAAGCSNPFIARHRVLVDAIAAPGTTKPSGISYRLVAKKSTVSQVQAQVNVIKACVDAALSGHGMYEPPPTVPPDIFIEVNYGVDTSGRVDPASRETFLQLSARANADRGIDRGTGPELWDVRVAVLGVAGRIESAMPLLCAVAATHMGTDTKFEMKTEIPQNSPMISAVRETAIKQLEAKAAGPAETPPPAASPTGPTTPPTPPVSTPAAPPPASGTTTGTAPGGTR